MTSQGIKRKHRGAQLPACSNQRILLFVFLASFAISTAIWHWAPTGWARAYEFALVALALGGIAVACGMTMYGQRSRRHRP